MISRCPSCDTRLKPTQATRCPQCGERLASSPPTDPEVDPSRRFWALLGVGGVVGGLLLVLIIGIVLCLTAGNRPHRSPNEELARAAEPIRGAQRADQPAPVPGPVRVIEPAPDGVGQAGAQPGSDPNMSLRVSEVTFLSSSARGQRFCIIADNSGSMKGQPLEYVKKELGSTLRGLKPESQFYVIFFNNGAVPMPAPGWLNGTQKDVAEVVSWMDRLHAGGGTQPLPAFRQAFELQPRPDVIFFMTDGIIPANVPTEVSRLNTREPRVAINTILFSAGNRGGRLAPAAGPAKGAQQLLKLAEDSGGTYRAFSAAAP